MSLPPPLVALLAYDYTARMQQMHVTLCAHPLMQRYILPSRAYAHLVSLLNRVSAAGVATTKQMEGWAREAQRGAVMASVGVKKGWNNEAVR